jgi:nucleoside-diphosphate-sugar epimerase
MGLYTVIGGTGFIGSEIVKLLKEQGHEVYLPKRNSNKLFLKSLGIVIYAAGYGDCNFPLEVLEANTILLSNLLSKGDFEQLVYISSTRIYMNSPQSSEDSDLRISSFDSRKLFNLTKLVSEEICLKSCKNIVIVRPSNVYGTALNSTLFLPSIVRDAINKSEINMYVDPTYEKDYVSVEDVAKATIMLTKKRNLAYKEYNLASGKNISAGVIAEIISQETGCKIIWHSKDNNENFPVTDISRLTQEINFTPKKLTSELKAMIRDFSTRMLLK